MVFELVPLSEGFFTGSNKVNCAAPYDGGQRIAYGTNNGVYLGDRREPGHAPVKVLDLPKVMQVDVLDKYQLLIVLSERQVITFPLDVLDPMDLPMGLQRAKRISSQTSFFKTGVCLDKTLVCIVKASKLSTTIKVLEAVSVDTSEGGDVLRMYKEFYMALTANSVHFLKTKLCFGCSKNFEIVDIETLDTQGLVDPADKALNFVEKQCPMVIYRVDQDFLLCYDSE